MANKKKDEKEPESEVKPPPAEPRRVAKMHYKEAEPKFRRKQASRKPKK